MYPFGAILEFAYFRRDAGCAGVIILPMEYSRSADSRLSVRPAVSRGFWLAVLAAVVFSLPSLAVGWLDDDVIHRTLLGTQLGGTQYGPHEAYCFAGGPNHHPPVWPLWWAEPGARVCFFRPLSSYTLVLDHWLFGDSALGAHLHGFVWLALALGGVYTLGRRLFDPRVATLSMAIYGLANFSGSTLAWVACRHAIVAAALCAGAIVLYVAGREARNHRHAALGVGALAVSLLAGEGALGGFAFLLAYESVRAGDAPKTRLCYVGVATLVAVTYVGLYSLLGFGANTGGYIDPFRAPGEFVAAVPVRLLALLADAVLGAPSDNWLMPAARPVLFLLGLLSALLVFAVGKLGAGGRDEGEKRWLRFLLLGALLSGVPVAASVLGGRVLMIPGIGLSIALAVMLRSAWSRRKELTGLRKTGASFALGGLSLGLFVLNPLFRVETAREFFAIEKAERELAASNLMDCRGAEHFLVLGTNELTVGLYARFLLAAQIAGRAFHPIAHSDGDLVLSRLDERRLRVTAAKGNAVAGALFEELRRSQKPFPANGRIPIGDANVLVEEASPAGVRTLVVETARPADDPAICWLRYDGKQLVRTPIPEVGASAKILYVPGPMSF